MVTFYTATINLTTKTTIKAAFNIWREKYPLKEIKYRCKQTSQCQAWDHQDKRIPDIELGSIWENITNRLNVNIEGLYANSPEEAHAEEQIEASFNNPSEVHKQIEEDNDEYDRETDDKKHPI